MHIKINILDLITKGLNVYVNCNEKIPTSSIYDIKANDFTDNGWLINI